MFFGKRLSSRIRALSQTLRLANRARLMQRHAPASSSPIRSLRSYQRRTPPGQPKDEIYGPLAGRALVSVLIVQPPGTSCAPGLADSLREQTYPHLEVIWVILGVGDTPADHLHLAVPHCTRVPVPLNVGIAEGHNIAQDRAQGECLLLLDPLTVLQRDGIAAMVESLREDRSVAAVTAKVHAPDQGQTIQSAGDWISWQGQTGSWGEHTPDRGQFDTPAFVDALSTACALVRRDALGWMPLFASDFWAGHHGAELSLRLTRHGARILYQPTARAHHQPMTSPPVGPTTQAYLQKRNHQALLAAHFKWQQPLEMLRAFKQWRADGSAHWRMKDCLPGNPSQADQSLLEDTLTLVSRAQCGAIYRRASPPKTIGIFNDYWSSLGGGELRALHLAQALSAYGRVYLISRTPFSLDQLRSRFGLETTNIFQAIIPDFAEHHTIDLDVFINTSYGSNMASRAGYSAHLLSFPHANADIAAIRSYDVILANSTFTADWTRRLWGDVPTQVLYPAVDTRISASRVRQRQIVSVGRFFRNGHNKKQLEMVEAFKSLLQAGTMNHWTLVLMGGCNQANPSDMEYLKEVRARSAGLPVTIVTDAPADAVSQALSESAIYWHCTGMGVDEEHPEQLEHFGMAIVEAMSAGAVPIAHRRGGPGEIIEPGVSGWLFDDAAGLCEATQRLASLHDTDPARFQAFGTHAQERARAFSIQAHHACVDTLFKAQLC